MWATLIFSGTAALFLTWTLSALWHLRWVRRLPALEMLTPAERSGRPQQPIRCSVIIAARNEEARIITLRQRGIRSCETFYPLKTLRTGNVR